jgi:ribosomal protein S18 acetylase RimI-like enzyme
MANDISIRPYAPADWDAIADVHDRARLNELRLSAGESAFLSLAQTFENEGLFDGKVFVGEIDARVCGFVAWTPAYLSWLYADPGMPRRGIGRALLRHALGDCDDHFETEVLEGNEPALALYLSEGFKIAERKEGRLEGNEAFAASGFRLVRRA